MASSAVSFLKPMDVFADIGAKLSTVPGTHTLTILHTVSTKGQSPGFSTGDKTHISGLQNIVKKIEDIKKENPISLIIDPGNSPSEFSADTAALPYSVVKKGKTKIGVINAGTSGSKDKPNTITESVATAISQTAELLRSSKNCSFIICIVQAFDANCLKLASLSSGVDMMFSCTDKPSLHNIRVVRNKCNHEVIISYVSTQDAMINHIDLTFNDKREKINVTSKAIFSGAEDESYAAILKRYALYNA